MKDLKISAKPKKTHKPKTTQKVVAMFLSVFFAFGVFQVALRPLPAQAIPVEDIALNLQTTAKTILDKIKDILEEAYKNGAAVLYKQTVGSFLNTIAQDTANWIADGGEGQEPLFISEGWGEYLQNTAEDAVATGVIAFAEQVGLGNICLSPGLAIDILLPQFEIPVVAKPKCSLDDLKQTWDVREPKFLENFTLSFEPGQNDLGVAVTFLNNLSAFQEKKEKEAEKELEESRFKAVKTAVSKVVKTPKTFVEETMKRDTLTNTQKTVLQYTGRPIADAIGVFADTLLARYTQKLKDGFFSLAGLAKGDDEDPLRSLRTSLLDPTAISTGVDVGQVFKPEIKQVTNFDLVTEFTICPVEVQYASVDNCVMDQPFSVAVRGGGADGFFTVQEAMDQGFLNRNWSFGFIDPVVGTEPSYNNGYAYSNMKKLRRARIIPVGWELAALRSRQLGQRITLGDVVDAYDNCDEQGGGAPEMRGFCNLVDPDWVLKAPVLNCTAKVPGQILVPGSKERADVCVDVKDCVVEGDNGECLSFDYCTNEKRVWDFPAEKCSEEFATCDQYFAQGESKSNNLWKGSTLDYTGCNAETAGCTWYALTKNAVGEWNDANRIFLTGSAAECDAQDAGCNEYIRMVNGTNLLRNSSFEDDEGNNYVLGNGDSTSFNGIPDGWSARSSNVTLSGQPLDGANSVQLTTISGNECLPGLQYVAPIGAFEVNQTFVISGQVRTDSSVAKSIQIGFENLRFTVENVDDNWTPFAFNFIMPATSDNYTLVLGSNNGSCGDLSGAESVFYDAIQLERGSAPSTYKNYGSVNRVFLSNAPACTFEEVGCQKYIPRDKNRGTEVNGIITGVDLCPQECVGYETFEQRETALEPTRWPDFIAASAGQCSAPEVGCQEFTNLDKLELGGESTEYYTQIKHCEKPSERGNQCATFFTWEGSDISGYQLVSFQLNANNTDGTGGPETVDGSTSCDPDTQSDCREFIDADGGRYLRNFAQTITCSDQCAPLRAAPGVVDSAECTARRGEWDDGTQRCIYQAIAEESVQCGAQAVGCREFIGNAGNNTAVVFTDNFEGTDTLAWLGGTRSTESTSVGGHSLKLGDQVGSLSETTAVQIFGLIPGKNYTVELNVKSSVSDVVTITGFLNEDGAANSGDLGSINTSTRNWNNYKLGPVQLPANSSGSVLLTLIVSGSSTKADAMNLFLDNILVRQISESLYLIKDSWNTPASCDTDPPLAGGVAGRSMLGCQEYSVSGDATKVPVYAKSFSRLCSEEKIGCEAVLDTFNSSDPYRQVFQAGDEAEIVVPEDNVRYLVNRKEFECLGESKGCQELGEPVFDQAGAIVGHNSLYKLNDPDKYGNILCPGESLFCKELSNSSGEIVYAKDPGLTQCEYRQIPETLPPIYAWFKIGDPDGEPNPQDCVDAERNRWVERCPETQISCTQFFEPITEESYYYKRNALKGSGAECNGTVNWKKGCVLFDDLSIREQLFKSGDDVDFVGAPTGCQTGDQGCDTNILLKVYLDRQCSQWLKGVSTSRFWDPLTQSYRTTSYSLGRCLEADPVNPSLCRKWDNEIDKEVLTIDAYQNRDTSWAGSDYTGYSIPNAYPVETMRQYNTGLDEDGEPIEYRLSHLTPVDGLPTCEKSSDCSQNPDRQICRQDIDTISGQFLGHCYISEGLDDLGKIAQAECRGYPEADSPFPSSLATFAPEDDEKNPGQIVGKDSLFTNANIGENGENVDCSYHRVDYGGQDRFFSIDSVPPSKIKIQGEENDFKRSDTFLGWQGYCIEKDPSRFINGSDSEPACLTWYPVDVIQGTLDLNNTKLSSSYLANNNETFYCAQGVFAEYLTVIPDACAACPSPFYDTIIKRAGGCGTPLITGAHIRANDTQLGGWTSDQWLQNLGYTPWGWIAYGISEAFGEDVYPRVLCVPRFGDGWYPKLYPVGNPSGIMCNSVARIQSPSGRNKAWTDRIQNEAFTVPDLGWTLNQQNNPFGSARPGTQILEELTQPLIVKLPPGEIPNAGSPFSLFPIYPQWVNDGNVSIRADNLPPSAVGQPYNRDENIDDGIRRLKELFARSYGVWSWKFAFESVCVGTCNGGVNNGESCSNINECGDSDRDVKYLCSIPPDGVCVGGQKNSFSCGDDLDCVADPDFTYNCVEAPADADSVFICEAGPFKGDSCDVDTDCGIDLGNGVCDTTKRRCQATKGGAFIYSTNSGRLCSSDDECNDAPACEVEKCSSDVGGVDSGVCAGLIAGDACGNAPKKNSYVRNPSLGWDIVEDDPALATRPVVQPVVPDSRTQSGLTEGFVPGGAFSVNGQTAGIIEAQDGRAPASISFYAYNENGEQMPLRTIMVDWGDGSDLSVSRGAFKNRKSVCRRFCPETLASQGCENDSQCEFTYGRDSFCDQNALKCVLPGLSCVSDVDCQVGEDVEATCEPFNFGDSDDACIQDSESVNGFFSFNHTYTCGGPAPCSFVPQVLVRDNWGATTRILFPGEILIQPPLNP